jgi:hypothetical protein
MDRDPDPGTSPSGPSALAAGGVPIWERIIPALLVTFAGYIALQCPDGWRWSLALGFGSAAACALVRDLRDLTHTTQANHCLHLGQMAGVTPEELASFQTFAKASTLNEGMILVAIAVGMTTPALFREVVAAATVLLLRGMVLDLTLPRDTREGLRGFRAKTEAP